MRLLATLCAAAIGVSCAVVSPPPMMMHQSESVVMRQPGSVSVGGSGGWGAGVFLGSSAGGLALLDLGVSRELVIGLSGGAGVNLDAEEYEPEIPRELYFGRAHGQYRPNGDSVLALNFGINAGGTDSGLVYLGPDVGLVFGYTFARRLRPYAGMALALSIPVRTGPGIADGEDDTASLRYPHTTFYMVPVGGIAVRLVANLELSAEGSCNFGVSSEDNVFSWSVTGGLRYTFGGRR